MFSATDLFSAAEIDEEDRYHSSDLFSEARDVPLRAANALFAEEPIWRSAADLVRPQLKSENSRDMPDNDDFFEVDLKAHLVESFSDPVKVLKAPEIPFMFVLEAHSHFITDTPLMELKKALVSSFEEKACCYSFCEHKFKVCALLGMESISFRVQVFRQENRHVVEFQRREGGSAQWVKLYRELFQILQAKHVEGLSVAAPFKRAFEPPPFPKSSPVDVDALEALAQMAGSEFSDIRLEGIKGLGLMADWGGYEMAQMPLVWKPLEEAVQSGDCTVSQCAATVIAKISSFCPASTRSALLQARRSIGEPAQAENPQVTLMRRQFDSALMV